MTCQVLNKSVDTQKCSVYIERHQHPAELFEMSPEAIKSQLDKSKKADLLRACRWHNLTTSKSDTVKTLREKLFAYLTSPKPVWVIESRHGYFKKRERVAGYEFPQTFMWAIQNATVFTSKAAAQSTIKRLGLDAFPHETTTEVVSV